MEENYENLINSAAYDDAPHISTFFGANATVILEPLSKSDFEDLDSENENNLQMPDLDKNSLDLSVTEPPAKRVAVCLEMLKITKTEKNFPIFWFKNLEKGGVVRMQINSYGKTKITLKCQKCDAKIKNMD